MGKPVTKAKKASPEFPSSESFLKTNPWNFLFRFVPALDSLRQYSWRSFSSDLMAGITVAAVAVPQAMAYALIAGVPPQYGLYTAVVMTLVGALLDSSRQLINGPTNAISIAVLSALVFLPPAERTSAAILLALLVGLVQVGITFLRLGDLTRFVSHGVIVGFTLGAAILIVLGQLKNLLGLEQDGNSQDHFLVRFWQTIRDSEIHGRTAAIGLGTIAFVLLVRWLKEKTGWRYCFLIPEFLLAVIAATFAVWFLDLNAGGVAVVGHIPASLPFFQLPDFNWSHVRNLSGSALAIAILGLLEAIAMAKAIAARTRQKLDIHQQCLSEGVANCVGGFFQCMPGSGSLTRSAINQQAGAISQWSGVIAAGAVALTILMLAPYAFHIPLATLAGILMVSAWRIVDRKQLMHHLRISRFDAYIVLVTAFSAVFISVEFCILIGVFISFTLYIPRAARLDLIPLQVTPERVIVEQKPTDTPCGRILIFRLDGELFFGSAPELEKHLEEISRRCANDIRVVVLSCKWARNPDAVCLGILEDFFERIKERKVVVLLAGVRPDLLEILHNSGLYSFLGKEHIFQENANNPSSTLVEAVRRAYDILGRDYCATCPKRLASNEEKDSWYYMI